MIKPNTCMMKLESKESHTQESTSHPGLELPSGLVEVLGWLFRAIQRTVTDAMISIEPQGWHGAPTSCHGWLILA